MLNAINASGTQTAGNGSPVGRLGKQDFLNLLLTQLRYQNPLRPMEDKEFVAQLAQFSALEELKNVGTGMNLILALTLIGRMVHAQVPADSKKPGSFEEIQGKVDGIRLLGTVPVLLVGGKEVHLDHVLSVQ